MTRTSSLRRSRTARAVVIGAAAVLALASAGCSSKSTDNSGGGGSSNLTIAPLVQVDSTGKEVPVKDTTAAADPAGDGKGKCAPQTIAMAGPLTGDNANLGLNIIRGVKLALDQHNKANPGCQVTVKEFDTEGDPQKATQVIPTIVSDSSLVALIGPTFSGETKATGAILNQANLLSLTPSATNVTLTTNGWGNFFRGLGNDGIQGPAVAGYLKGTGKFKKICVIQDDTDYGTGLAKTVTEGLGSIADPSCAASVKAKQKDFSATVSKMASAKPDGIFYAGYYAEAAPLVSQLRDGGVTATFISDDGTKDVEFTKQAGSKSKDSLLSCPCGPAGDKFAAAYKAFNNYEPGTYSTEGYDLTTIVLKGIESGKTSRPDLVDFVKNYDGQGLAREYKWGSTGELANALIWMYQVK
ncbi:branched-chain amino acid ABC transporter substrate-binding protein [Nocardia seriolae]|uniref:branched-chain amino acid ABC transporter substrate-binding protein n=1 Tax=Nocardia seriolae TaxID=37332 RepID=UPI0005EF6FCA|nr:branched-chain amino acid ABC transporter substrate-binding protein [Nocardia seriolae]MTJ62498.1 ABC transporter substrate-binding protein [Nocardia seriolae]MTJ75524.1 ABC transporter substrate-binding protein [Nocardia seriolae]MTJ87399.1 ABC transporter substrate-binding protein [Nocardia seriolae]MTK31391.1 ABC transporter substrate-binding protein [Nocardia seriolae]MTK40448.1 ABC transporter substrate-binding protein [Nocardia seriolae]